MTRARTVLTQPRPDANVRVMRAWLARWGVTSDLLGPVRTLRVTRLRRGGAPPSALRWRLHFMT
jgi:hypothetical protein